MSRPDVARRRVRALSARTHYVVGFGQVHFDPGSKHEEARFPLMPESEIDILVSRGWIADDVEEVVPQDAPAPVAKPRGRKPAPVATDEPAASDDADQAPV